MLRTAPLSASSTMRRRTSAVCSMSFAGYIALLFPTGPRRAGAPLAAEAARDEAVLRPLRIGDVLLAIRRGRLVLERSVDRLVLLLQHFVPVERQGRHGSSWVPVCEVGRIFFTFPIQKERVNLCLGSVHE